MRTASSAKTPVDRARSATASALACTSAGSNADHETDGSRTSADRSAIVVGSAPCTCSRRASRSGGSVAGLCCSLSVMPGNLEEIPHAHRR